MIRPVLIAAALTTLALPATAQSTLERLETVAVAMNQMMFDGMVAGTPALEGNMPSPEWSDDLRTAYTCMYDGYVAQVGEDAVANMVSAMEVQLETASPEELAQGGGGVANPEGLTDDQGREIVMGCGMMEAFMDHMSSSGALEILMQDDQ